MWFQFPRYCRLLEHTEVPINSYVLREYIMISGTSSPWKIKLLVSDVIKE
jgi:hypothetical protein